REGWDICPFATSCETRAGRNAAAGRRDQEPGQGMAKNDRHLFSSESVTEGHPDKIADQISDAVLDALLAQDPMSRVACETLVTTGLPFGAGGGRRKAYANHPSIFRNTIKDVGYTRAKYGFDYETCAVISALHE